MTYSKKLLRDLKSVLLYWSPNDKNVEAVLILHRRGLAGQDLESVEGS